MEYTMNQRIQKPMVNRHRFMAPHNVYRCKGEDKWVAIAITTDEEWKALCDILGKPDLASNEKFSNPLSRWQNQKYLDKLIEEWTIQHTGYEVMYLLQSRGIPAGPVMNDEEIFKDPHLRARGFYITVDHPEAGMKPCSGISFKLSETPGYIRMPAPCLGQDNHYVLKKLLDFSDREIADLESEQIIGTEPIDSAVS